MDHQAENRIAPRLKLPPMYTLIRVKPLGEANYQWTGHVYDVSETGIKFELDSPLQAGEEIQIKAILPGLQHTTIEAHGRVIRIHDSEQDFGPCRMAMIFDQFDTHVDKMKLTNFLNTQGLKLAA